MAEYVDMGMDDVMSFETATGTTSTGIPVKVESILASCSALSATVILNFERTNSYCKAHALQSIMLFISFFVISLPVLILCVAIGKVFQTLYILMLLGYAAIKAFFITMAIIRSGTETFVGIPGLATWIYSIAARY